MRNMNNIVKISGIVLAAMITAISFSNVAYAATATPSSYGIFVTGDDKVYNYDFLSTTASSSNVDWPVGMVFCQNANIDKVKNNIYWGLAPFATAMKSRMSDNNGATYIWDTDQGTKVGYWYSSSLATYTYLHLRLYAPNPPDYLTSTVGLGKWVAGTAHYDQWPSESWSGYSENAEGDLAAYAIGKGYTVFSDNMNWFNPESYRIQGGNHMWLNDGWATRVCMS